MTAWTREREREVAEWVKETCLLHGTSVSTAYEVAAIFVEGLAADRRPLEVPA